MKKTIFVVVLIILILSVFLYLRFEDEIKYYNYSYEMIDNFSDTTNKNVYRFYFVGVSSTERDYINYVSEKEIKPILKTFQGKGILIAHFYKLSDTLKLPDNMFKQLKYKYPNKANFDKNLRYIIRGAVKTYFCEPDKYDDTLFYNHMVVPKYGVKAKDVLK